MCENKPCVMSGWSSNHHVAEHRGYLIQTVNIGLTFCGHFLCGASYDSNLLLASKGKSRRKVLRSDVSRLSRFGHQRHLFRG